MMNKKGFKGVVLMHHTSNWLNSLDKGFDYDITTEELVEKDTYFLIKDKTINTQK